MNSNNYFLVKVKLTRQSEEDGTFKRVSERYMFPDATFGGVENQTFSEMEKTTKGEVVIDSIQRTDVFDILRYEENNDIWYKVIIAAQDPESEKKKTIKYNIYVQANSVKEADSRIKESLRNSVLDYRIKTVTDTDILEIF